MTDRKERWFNRSLDQWVIDITQEAKRDCVSLQQVYGALVDDFNLPENEFDIVIKHVLERVFSAGVTPVIQDMDGRLMRDMTFTGSPETMARDVFASVKRDPELATFSGIWLGNPS